MILEKVKVQLELHKNQLIHKNIVAGTSGGPDSMALLDALCFWKDHFHYRIVVCHINHGLRGEQSDGEAELVADFAEKRGLLYRYLKVNLKEIAAERKLSTQAAGHQVRKAFFLQTARELDSESVFLAHHQDDRLESFFMHLFSGAGLQGLVSLPASQSYERDIHVLRPLVETNKKEILEYCLERNIPFSEDPSNESLEYQRNRIRHTLLPYLRQAHISSLDQVVGRTISVLEEENRFMENLARSALSQVSEINQGQVEIHLKRFASLELALRRRVVRHCLQYLDPRIAISFEKMETLLRLLEGGQGRKYYRLSAGHELTVEYEKGIFAPIKEKVKESVIPSGIRPLEIPWKEAMDCLRNGTLMLDDAREIQIASPSQWEHAFLKNGMGFPLPEQEGLAGNWVFRKKNPGDQIRPVGGKNKSLKKYLIEKKVPLEIRESLWVLAEASRILWIPGLAVSENVTNHLPAGSVLLLKHSLKNKPQCDKVY